MRRIKLNPSRQQRERLNKYGDAVRYTYNECVAAVNSKALPANKMKLRNAFVTAKNNDDYFHDKQMVTHLGLRSQWRVDAGSSETLTSP